MESAFIRLLDLCECTPTKWKDRLQIRKHIYVDGCMEQEWTGGRVMGGIHEVWSNGYHVTSPPTSTTLTISNVRIFDLLQHRGPHGCVAFLVLLDFLGAEVEPLADAAGALI